jgi:hypothetical protein
MNYIHRQVDPVHYPRVVFVPPHKCQVSKRSMQSNVTLSGKDWDGSGRGLFEKLPWHLNAGTERNHEIPKDMEHFRMNMWSLASTPTRPVHVYAGLPIRFCFGCGRLFCALSL